MTALPWVFDDGGRADAGYKGNTGDCMCRALSIATGMPYQEAYDLINQYAKRERPRAGSRRSGARTGVHTRTARRLMADLDWTWVPTMHIGSGTTVHLAQNELPIDKGPLLVSVSRHYVAVVAGVVRDLADPTRDGTRAVYGYHYKETR